jgi:hypothetical protein
VGIIYSQDSDHLLIDNEPEVQVILTVDTHPKSDIDVINSPNDQISCHECTNCNKKSDITTRICESNINMCYVNLF